MIKRQSILSILAHYGARLGIMYSVPAAGTLGSLIGFVSLLIVQWCGYTITWQVLLVMILFALWAVEKTRHHYRSTDPREIIIDEFIGIVVTFFGWNLTPLASLSGFLFFRFFDITKWCGVHYFERLPGAWGILGDDIAAGLLAHGLLYIIFA